MRLTGLIRPDLFQPFTSGKSTAIPVKQSLLSIPSLCAGGSGGCKVDGVTIVAWLTPKRVEFVTWGRFRSLQSVPMTAKNFRIDPPRALRLPKVLSSLDFRISKAVGS